MKNKNYNIGLSIGFGGEFIVLTKHSKGWHEMFRKFKINPAYKTKENFEHFCYLKYYGIDAESVFVEKINKI